VKETTATYGINDGITSKRYSLNLFSTVLWNARQATADCNMKENDITKK
jgi:hypothetical protein